ncbi:MAG: cupin domain-containing protein [Planctomycetales bacterium]|nr:cupin domain-containing protein [Planctomycetales bacterium]
MAISHAQPGEVINVRPLQSDLAVSKTMTLFKTDTVEVLRMVLPRGKKIAEHKAPGELMVQCIEGRVAFTTMGKTNDLSAGDLLYLAVGEPHALHALEDSTLLVSILFR